jgi:hypothetical protein
LVIFGALLLLTIRFARNGLLALAYQALKQHGLRGLVTRKAGS